MLQRSGVVVVTAVYCCCCGSVSLQGGIVLSPVTLVCVRFDKQTGVGGVRGNRTGDVFCLACQSVSLWRCIHAKKKQKKKREGKGRNRVMGTEIGVRGCSGEVRNRF